MKKILYFLSSRFFWILVGITCLSLLIWFYGELLAFGDFQPFEETWVKILCIGLLFAIFALRIIWKKIKQAKVNDELIDEMKASQEPMLKHEQNDSSMRSQFEEIDALLRNAKFSNKKKGLLGRYFNGQYLYQMPWYVVLGDTGSGKTALLKQSGLNFPLESSYGQSIDGLAGTKDCSWFLSDDAIWLDTAGSLAIHGLSYHDTYNWQEFVSQLQRYRSRQPVNGALITVSVEQLLSSDEGLLQVANQLRKRINEMYTQFGIRFPIYLIITKADLINGFNQFFSEISLEFQKKPLGFEIPLDKLNEPDNLVVGYVAKELENMVDAIDSSYLQAMHIVESNNDKRALASFSDDFDFINRRLVAFSEVFFKSSKFEKNVFWRGVYFTSAIQDNDTYSPSLNTIASEFAINSNDITDTSPHSEAHKSYFIHDLLSKNVTKEAPLAELNTSWSYRLRSYRWIPLLLIVLLILFLIYSLFKSYFNNRDYLRLVENKTVALQKDLSSITTTKDIVQAIKMAVDIRNTSDIENIELTSLNDPPYSYRMGLYKGQSTKEISESAYRRALRTTVLPMIHHRIDYVLRQQVKTDTASSYDTLKAYIMLYMPEHYNKTFLMDWLLKDMKFELDKLSDSEKLQIRHSLDFVLNSDNVDPSLPYDSELVEKSREQNTRHDLSHMILENAYNQIQRDIFSSEETVIKPVSFLTMGGNGTRQVFKTKNNQSLSHPIDYRYTKDIYEDYLLPEIERRVKIVSSEEDWVLAEYSSELDNEKKTLEMVKNTYYKQYIEAWNKYLDNLSLKQPENLEQAKEDLKVLSDEYSSPLLKMIIGINENTSLESSGQLYNQISETLVQTKETLTQKAKNLVNNFGDDEANQQNVDLSTEAIIESRPTLRNNQITEAVDEQTSQVNTVRSQVRSRDVYGLAENLPSDSTVVDVEDGRVKNVSNTLVAQRFSAYSNLVGEGSSDESSLDEIIQSIETLYEYIDELNFSIDKGVDLPDTKPVIEFRADISRLPMPFQGMFNNLSANLLELWYKEQKKREEELARKKEALKAELEAKELQDKQEQRQREDKIREEQRQREDQIRQEQEAKEEKLRQEQQQREQALLQKIEDQKQEVSRKNEKLLASSVENKINAVSKPCNLLTQNYFPFIKSDQQASYADFQSVFGKQGYVSANRIDPQVVGIAGVSTVTALAKTNDKFSNFSRMNDMLKVNNIYFNSNDVATFNFSVSVLNLDAGVERLVLKYGDNTYEYAHGPIPTYNLVWPPSNSQRISLGLYKDSQVMATIKEEGLWSLYKLMEAGRYQKKNNREYEVSYNIEGYDVKLKFANKSIKDPLDINNFRNLVCL